ncbi:Fc.00g040330.m01.CDS01 [Cosmosporella sp. VM-42]
MGAAVDETPAVALSFANNFWGKEDAGVTPLLGRMAGAKTTCDELRSFYGARASIEEEYARKLLSLCRKPLGSQETGTLKTSLDTVRGELEQMAKQHQSNAAQMKTELEEPLAAFSGGMKERRKIVQNTVEKLLKTKMQQTHHVMKTRDKYEQECLKIKGYLAQGHMVMGQEERRNKAKLEKTQISLATSNTEYENAVKALEETTARWNREWKAAADKFQDLEEERLDFTKSSLWTFANIASTVCVSDDSSCEKIRISLEKMDVEKDIVTFISERGTGQEIPDAPKYINFCRGDINDSQSEASEDDNYSVAQFPRSINPAFRSSSPQPSTFESHHDPNSTLAQNLAHREAVPANKRETSFEREKLPRPAQLEPIQYQPALRQRPQPPQQQLPPPLQQPAPQSVQKYYDELPQQSAPQQHNLQQLQQHSSQQLQQHITQPLQPRPQPLAKPLAKPMPQAIAQPRPQPTRPSMEMRRSTDDQFHRKPPSVHGGYDASQHGPVAAVPHDPYPMDGMTMLCRTGPSGPPSDRSSQLTSNRPSSRDSHSHSDYSNPTSFSSMEPPSGKTSPTKEDPPPVQSPTKIVMKKKSGFLKNHSPFRRKSQKEMQPPAQSNRNTWHAASNRNGGSPARRPQLFNQDPPSLLQDRTQSPEPIDANASLALGVGQNVFPVSNTDTKKRQGSTPAAKEAEETDPIALALAELKGVTLGKQSSVRMSADHYHGIATPVPGSDAGNSAANSRSVPTLGNRDLAAAKRGTPPPLYQPQTQISRLGVPPPAVTSKAMKEATKKATAQTRNVFGDGGRSGAGSYNAAPASRPATRGTDMGRGESGSYSAAPSSRSGTRSADMGRGESGSYSGAPSRSGTRATEMPRAESGGYSVPPVSRSGTRATEMSRGESLAYSTSPGSRPGTRGTDMSRGGSGVYGTSPISRPTTRGTDIPRAASPAPMRSVSPQPSMNNDSSRMSYRSASPNPYGGSQRAPSQMSSPQKRGSVDQGYYRQPSPHQSSRAPSPASFRQQTRPQSSYGGSEMSAQLSQAGDDYGSQRSRSGRPESRAMGLYDGGESRQRSKSVADPSRLYTQDGRPILHYARALYMYQPAIPEELGFAKGDYLAVLRHQDDGWWEAEVHGTNGRIGLVPSNYLQPC